MLREWTDSAFARAFKRFAQLAVVGIALAGLTACGGGGSESSTPSTPTPTPTPTPTIPVTPPSAASIRFTIVDNCNDSRGLEYRFFEQTTSNRQNTGRSWPGGIRFYSSTGYEVPNTVTLSCQAGRGACYGGRINGLPASSFGAGFDGRRRCTNCCLSCGQQSSQIRIGCPGSTTPTPTPIPTSTAYVAVYAGQNNSETAWGLGTGSSASEAERDAERICELGGITCTTRIRGIPNACGAVAISECDRDQGCGTPAFGIASHSTRRGAEASAIQVCERFTTRGVNLGTCRVATNSDRGAAVRCVGTAQ